jgi:hypothetical protein
MVIEHICTGGNAYPQYPSDGGKYGISMADYFAAHVIAGICANPNTVVPVTPEALEELAQNAYQIACAMVELREDTPVEPTPVPPEPLPSEPELMPLGVKPEPVSPPSPKRNRFLCRAPTA